MSRQSPCCVKQESTRHTTTGVPVISHLLRVTLLACVMCVGIALLQAQWGRAPSDLHDQVLVQRNGTTYRCERSVIATQFGAPFEWMSSMETWLVCEGDEQVFGMHSNFTGWASDDFTLRAAGLSFWVPGCWRVAPLLSSIAVFATGIQLVWLGVSWCRRSRENLECCHQCEYPRSSSICPECGSPHRTSPPLHWYGIRLTKRIVMIAAAVGAIAAIGKQSCGRLECDYTVVYDSLRVGGNETSELRWDSVAAPPAVTPSAHEVQAFFRMDVRPHWIATVTLGWGSPNNRPLAASAVRRELFRRWGLWLPLGRERCDDIAGELSGVAIYVPGVCDWICGACTAIAFLVGAVHCIGSWRARAGSVANASRINGLSRSQATP